MHQPAQITTERGKHIIPTLAQHLTQTYGKGWSAQQLRQCLAIAVAGL